MPPVAHAPPLASSSEIAEQDALTTSVLTNAGLVETDLDEDNNLIFPLPQEAEILRIVRGYDSKKTSGLKVRCAACPQHQPHYRGFRVELTTGQQARIGVNCGETHFGEGAWQSAVSDYDRRVEHANFVARIEPALSAIAKIMPLIEDWHSKTKRLGSSISKLQREMPQLSLRLSAVAKERDGRLERERRVKRKETNRQGIEEQKTRVDITIVGKIPFPGMFLGETPNHGLNGAKTALGVAVALLANKRDSASLAKAFKQLREGRQHLLAAAQIHRSALSNLESGWLSALCEWADRSDDLDGRYEMRGRAIFHNDGINEASFEFPDASEIGTPPIDAIMREWP